MSLPLCPVIDIIIVFTAAAGSFYETPKMLFKEARRRCLIPRLSRIPALIDGRFTADFPRLTMGATLHYFVLCAHSALSLSIEIDDDFQRRHFKRRGFCRHLLQSKSPASGQPMASAVYQSTRTTLILLPQPPTEMGAAWTLFLYTHTFYKTQTQLSVTCT